MASRRDELNAYTFARKRMVGAFLQPAGGGSDEDAPRPIRAVVPSLVLGAVVLAGFGVWGMIKPSAPVGWDDGKNVIVGKDSTTRYVVLPGPDGGKVLHPVINMASAKLVLPADSKVVFVADSVLDNYKDHGPTIGIPYAPDKLPSAGDAGQAKKWSVCDRPGADDDHPNQGVFIAAGAEAQTLARKDRMLGGGQALYVQAPRANGADGPQYLVDPQGRKHQLGTAGMGEADMRALRLALFGTQSKPEHVTRQWLDTLAEGSPIVFPAVPGLTAAKSPSSVQLADPAERFVGRLVTSGDAYYVVGADRLYQVTAFAAQLIQMNPLTAVAYDHKPPTVATISPADNASYTRDYDSSGPLAKVPDWPAAKPGDAVNGGDATGARAVVCSTFEGMAAGGVQRSVWAGTDFPAPYTPGTATAHVSPGHGLFYRAMDSSAQASGSDFLITETGLRYAVPANNDGQAAGAGAGPSPDPSADPAQAGAAAAPPSTNEAQARLGYKDDQPVAVPKAWSDLVPAGPVLNTRTATQAQNS
ncbi:type VII secretion protein EccB [Streptomyces tateyamensis]|uniref:Type VII secretion protein EccB n=1 Tax=Streptomyces tateyamensis TaxID=565073 RepID=A0A2V4NYA7_9ACTN|nr:type VII secretion protein EccB [Streptomyces tateyamensis]PYC81944.1 type VII secretion protein EccB [Streptomyces tateyamensis]